MAVCLAGLQFLAVLAVVSSSYVTSERALIHHARDLLSDVGAGTIEHARSFLSPAEAAAELAARLAQNRVIASDDPQQLEQLLFQHLQIAPHFAGVYYGAENGDFVMVRRDPTGPGPFQSKIVTHEGGQHRVELIWRTADFIEISRRVDPEDDYDPRLRPWYQLARSHQQTIWTDPYIFFTSQQPGITLASPVKEIGAGRRDYTRVKGVVGVDIEISRISDFLAGLKIGTHGRALIIHRNGDVVAHPLDKILRIKNEDGTLRFSKISEIADPIARAAFADLLVDGHVQVAKETPSEFVYEGDSYVATVMPMGSDKLPWTIAVYAPEDDFTNVIKENRTENIWIAALVAGMSGAVGLLLANYIYKPVRAFAVRSSLISQGEIDPKAPTPRTYRELEQANEALVQQIAARRAAEQEYGRTFELSSLGMAQLVSHCGAFLRVNPRFCEITGYSAEELSGMTMSDLGAPEHAITWPYQPDGSRDFVSTKEVRLARKNGQMIWVSVNGNLILDSSGAPMHVMLTIDDITASREKEARIEQLNRDLSHLARVNTMGQMASGLAHELNQPLTAIAQNADTALLVLSRQEIEDPELRDILAEIERQSLRAGEIIHALRAFIRKDEGAKVAFDIRQLIDEAQHLLQAEITDGGVLIERHFEPNLPQAFANRVQVAQVVVNLLRNAIEAMNSDRDNERCITLSAEIAEGAIKVSVRDTGPGLSADVNPFSRFETTKLGGMGLGLSICKSMIEANGGKIWHVEGQGRGSTFCFTVPAAGVPRVL